MSNENLDSTSLKIAVLLDAFPVLAHTFILNQLTGLIDRGHQVDIYATCQPQSECVHEIVSAYQLVDRTRYWSSFSKRRSIRLLRAPFLAAQLACIRPGLVARAFSGRRYGPYWKSFRYLFGSWAFRRDAVAYDVVHCHFGGMGLVGHFLTDNALLHGPVITTFHGSDVFEMPRIWSRDVYRPLFARGEHFTANSEFTKSRLIELGCPADRITIIRMGIRLDEFRFEAHQLEPGETPSLISVARLVPIKGIEYGVRAVAILRDQGIKVEYRVVGDGPLKNELQVLSERLGISDRVHWLGWQDRTGVVDALRRSHLLLAPSASSATETEKRGEGQGVALQEAQAMGLPVIATHNGAFPEGLDEGKSGWLVPERDADAIASTVQEFIARQSEWPEFGAAGRRFVERRFDLHKLNDELVELYRHVSGQNSATTRND